MQVLTEQIPSKSVIAIANGTKSEHSQTRKRTQRRTTNAIFPPAPESGYQSGYIISASASPIESKRDNLWGMRGHRVGPGPRMYPVDLINLRLSGERLFPPDPRSGYQNFSQRRPSNRIGTTSGDAWATSGPKCNRGILSTRTCSRNDASSLFLLGEGINKGIITPTAVPARRDNTGPGDAWAAVGGQNITGGIVPAYLQAFR